MVKLVEGVKNIRVSFKYDTALVDIMRAQKGRKWDGINKVWEIPVGEKENLLKALEGYELEIVQLEICTITIDKKSRVITLDANAKKNKRALAIVKNYLMADNVYRIHKVYDIDNEIKDLKQYASDEILIIIEEPTEPTEPTEKVKKEEVTENKIENKIEKIETKEVKIEGVEFKTQPFQHQIEGVEFGIKNDKFILADEQGLGKSKQAIDIACNKKATKGYKHCLIICGVNGLKYNWEKEVAIHSNEKSIILGGKKGTNAAKLKDLDTISKDTYFLITNIESMRNKEIVEKLVEMCTNETIGMIIVDEMHKCKNAASQQAKGLLKLETACKIAMTGTPLMNTPLDVYPMLKWTGLEKHSFFQFKKRYAIMGGFGGYQVMGYKNLNEIQEKLDKKMLRRLKKDVLDLPAKVKTTEYVELGKEQDKIYKEVLFDIRQNVDKIKAAANPLSQLIRLRQATASAELLSSTITESAKLQRLAELVEDAEGNGQKVIVFSNWTQMTRLAEKVLKQYNPVLITGETKESERVQNQNTFTNNPDCKVIIGTIGAMGTGLTLTAASTVIFLDSPWTRAEKEQAEDRAHRIGTTGTVNIITIVCKDTIDERIEEIIEGKGKMADALIDGEIKFNKNDTVDFLLS